MLHVNSHMFECTQNFLCARNAPRAQHTQCKQLVLLEVHSSTSIIENCSAMCTEISRETLYRYNMYRAQGLYCTKNGDFLCTVPVPNEKHMERNGGLGSRNPTVLRERRIGHARRLKSSCQSDK